jgi:hypothetical protein
MIQIRDAFLSRANLNVVVVDWSKGNCKVFW